MQKSVVSGVNYPYMHTDEQTEIVAKRTCQANAADENSAFIFTVFVKSVPLYHFKLVCVVLHMAVKEFFKIYF